MAIAAWAAPVGTNDAARAVRAWVRRGGALGARLGTDVASVGVHTITNGILFYSVATKGGGTVFTSADDALEPILAFTSERGAEAAARDPKSPLYALLNRDVIGRTRLRKAAPLRLAALASANASSASSRWARLLDEAAQHENSNPQTSNLKLQAQSSNPSIGDLRVPPLVKTAWGQSTDGGGADCYNYYVTNRYVCGCVATAMSQLMRTHEWPRESRAFVTNGCFVNDNPFPAVSLGGVYDWANMPLEPCGADADAMTDVSREAIGRLCYDAGVSVRMNWTAGGSGAYMEAVGAALRDNFGYGSAYSSEGRYAQPDEDGIARKVLANLNAGYPVLFGISYDNFGWHIFGHAIVGDGYGYNDDALYVHLNMGWNGLADLWYQLPEMGPAGSCEFNSLDDIVYNIIPGGSDEKAVLAGRVCLANDLPVPNASVAIYVEGSETPITNLTANAAGVYGTVLPAGETYEVRATCGEFSGSETVVLTAPELSYCAATNYDDRILFETEKYVAGDADPGNALVDVTVRGEPSGEPLEWALPATLEAAQGCPYEQTFSVSGGNAPYVWSLPKKGYSMLDLPTRSYDAIPFETPYWNGDFDNEDKGVFVELGFDFPFGDRIVRSVLVTQQGLRIGEDEIGSFSYVEAIGIRVSRTATSYTFDYDGQAYTLNADGTIVVSFDLYESKATLHLKVFGKDYDFPVVRETNDEPKSDVLIFREGPPLGLAFDRTTGTLSGTPLQTGEQRFDLAVVDSFGLALTNTFTLVVGEVGNLWPVIEGIEGRPDAEEMFLKYGEEQKFVVNVSDPEGDDVCVRMYVNGELFAQTNGVSGSGGSAAFAFSRELPSDEDATRWQAIRVTVSDATSSEAVCDSWTVRMTRDWYVVPESAESYQDQDGTAAHPREYQGSLPLGAGDTVLFQAGRYYSSLYVDRDIPVTFVAADFPARTTVYGIRASGRVSTAWSYDEVPVTNCVFRGFTVEGTVWGGTLEQCCIRHAYDRYSGPAVADSILINCVLAANETVGTVDRSVLYNCTVVNNAGYGLDGSSTAYNSIVWNNAGGDALEGATLVSCHCEGDPMLANTEPGDCRLRSCSPCLDAGDNDYLPAGLTNDFVGAARIQNGAVDIGAYEGAAVSGYMVWSSAVGYGAVTQSAENAEAGGEITFTFLDRPIDHIETNGVAVAVEGDTFVWRDIQSDGTLVAYFGPQDFYVDGTNGSNTNDGKTCETALKTIAEAQELAVDGETIYVLPGVYDSVYECWADDGVKHLRLESTDGAAVTFIDGRRREDRCVTDQARSLTVVGFTLCNGNAYSSGRNEGGGAYGGTFYDCVITNCYAKQRGGGTCSSTLYNCTVVGNRVGYLNTNGARYGGGMYRGTAYGCTICGNHVWSKTGYKVDPQRVYGGGAASATLVNCRVYDNYICAELEHDGGGTYSCQLEDTFVWNNTDGDRNANPPVMASNDDARSWGTFYEAEPLISGLDELATAFAGAANVTDNIASEGDLTALNALLAGAGMTSVADLTTAQKAHAYESLVLKDILMAPTLFEEKPEMTIGDFVPSADSSGEWTFTVSLKAGEADVAMDVYALADRVRVGASADGITDWPVLTAFPNQAASSLTYAIDPGTNTSFFVRIDLTR